MGEKPCDRCIREATCKNKLSCKYWLDWFKPRWRGIYEMGVILKAERAARQKAEEIEQKRKETSIWKK